MNINPMLALPVNGIVNLPPQNGALPAPPSSLTDVGRELGKQFQLEKGIDYYNKRSDETLFSELRALDAES